MNGQQVPGPLLQSALDYVNTALQQMANTIQADGETASTAIVLTAKHGQSPQNNAQLQRIDDGPIIAGVNAAWAALHPSNTTLVVQEADDDGLLWWLSDRSQAATDFVKNYLWTHSAPAVNFAGRKRSPSSTPAWPRSTPVSSRHSSSASRALIRTILTCSGSRRSARFTRPARRSPNMAATTRPIVTFRSSSMRQVSSGLARQAVGWKRLRSLRRS